jgi:hypothetical protein
MNYLFPTLPIFGFDRNDGFIAPLGPVLSSDLYRRVRLRWRVRAALRAA